MTLVKDLRETAMVRTKPEERKQLRDYADALHSAIKRFSEHHTGANLIMVNGLWSRAYNYLKNLPPENKSNPPLASAMEEKMRMAA